MRTTALFLLLLLHTTNARADAETCARAAEDAQHERQRGKLLDARQHFVSCSSQECPDLIRKDCTRWLGDLESAIPTLVFRARDARGADVTGVRVLEGDRTIASRLDGVHTPIDPGPHVLRFETPGASAQETSILVTEGEQNRAVEVVFNARLRPDGSLEPMPPDDRRLNTVAVDRVVTTHRTGWVFPAIATATLAVGALITYGIAEATGTSDFNALDRTCGRTGSCMSSDVDSVRTRLYYVAPVALTTGIVLAAASAIMFLIASRPVQQRVVALIGGSAP